MRTNINEKAAYKLLNSSYNEAFEAQDFDPLEYFIPIHRILMSNKYGASDLSELARYVIGCGGLRLGPSSVVATAGAIRATALRFPNQAVDWFLELAGECQNQKRCFSPETLTRLTLALTLAQFDIVADIRVDVSPRVSVLVPYARVWQKVLEPVLVGKAMSEWEVPQRGGELLQNEDFRTRLHGSLKGWLGLMPHSSEDFLLELGIFLAEFEETSKSYPSQSFHHWLVGRMVFAYCDQLALSERIRLLFPKSA
ncbi:MAG: hypothetical protein Q7K33_02660 [Candidatus Berkelbacteria bacterium]|nr:hypothetical protein [Candidatus Berkelbacteria bacterium]